MFPDWPKAPDSAYEKVNMFSRQRVRQSHEPAPTGMDMFCAKVLRILSRQDPSTSALNISASLHGRATGATGCSGWGAGARV